MTKHEKKNKWLTLFLLVLSSIVLGYATLTRGAVGGSDFSAYIMQAKSVVERNPHEFLKRSNSLLRSRCNLRDL